MVDQDFYFSRTKAQSMARRQRALSDSSRSVDVDPVLHATNWLTESTGIGMCLLKSTITKIMNNIIP
jgi:hypothetical protein